MKHMKRLLFLGLLIASLSIADAQVSASGKVIQRGSEGRPCIVPRVFTYGTPDKAMYLTIENKDDKTVTIYDENLEELRTIPISGAVDLTCTSEQQVRTPIVYVNRADTALHQNNAMTWEEAKEWLSSNTICSYKENYEFWPTDTSDLSLYYIPYAEYIDVLRSKFAGRYPKMYFYWNPADSKIYRVSVNYGYNLQGDWMSLGSETYSGNTDLEDCYLLDYDTNNGSVGDVNYPRWHTLTQTLFNQDEKFEYIVGNWEDTPIYDEQQDQDGDGEIDVRALRSGHRSGYSVYSEDGTLIQSIPDVTNGGLFDIFIFGGNTYFLVEDATDYIFYRIDSRTSDVRKVASMRRTAVADYDLRGMRQPVDQKGVHIIKYNDGSAVKRIVR